MSAPHNPDLEVLADPRVQPDSFVVYPTDYDLIPYSDKESWALTVTNGHAYGWSIRPGIGVSGSQALNRKGERIFERRGSGHNKARRWPLDEALRIALSIVDHHKVAGISAAEAVAKRDQILASFEQRKSPVERDCQGNALGSSCECKAAADCVLTRPGVDGAA